MPEVVVVDHPLVAHKLAMLRSAETGQQLFGQLLNELTYLMMYEATRDLETVEREVDTPLARARVRMLDESIVLVPVLRAGLGMLGGSQNLLPQARVGFVGMYRDEDTLEPVEYYLKVPELAGALVMVLDPMLATGGSLVGAVSRLKEHGATRLRVISVLASPEGIDNMRNAHPDVAVFCSSIDEKLDKHGYIIPGLGDCGDRLYGTR